MNIFLEIILSSVTLGLSTMWPIRSRGDYRRPAESWKYHIQEEQGNINALVYFSPNAAKNFWWLFSEGDTHRKFNRDLGLSELVGTVAKLLSQKLIKVVFKEMQIIFNICRKRQKKSNFSTYDIHKLKVTIGMIKIWNKWKMLQERWHTGRDYLKFREDSEVIPNKFLCNHLWGMWDYSDMPVT